MADKNGFDPFDMWKNLYQQYDPTGVASWMRR